MEIEQKLEHVVKDARYIRDRYLEIEKDKKEIITSEYGYIKLSAMYGELLHQLKYVLSWMEVD